MERERDVQEWLRQRGAETIEHPGGTLYAHLCRVHDRLGNLGLGTDLQLAGLTHAAYGTDGFDVVLVDRADRSVLRDLIGEDAEVIVYLYAACDRRRTWPRLADTGEVCNRFTGEVETPDAARLRTFVDLTVANELDIVEQDRAAGLLPHQRADPTDLRRKSLLDLDRRAAGWAWYQPSGKRARECRILRAPVVNAGGRQVVVMGAFRAGSRVAATMYGHDGRPCHDGAVFTTGYRPAGWVPRLS